MKTKTLAMMAGLVTAGVIYFCIPASQMQAQPSAVQAAGTPPIGRLVDIELVAWPLTTERAGIVKGTLLSMTGDWIVVKDGTYEHWLPKEKVLNMKASR
jgi:hypothetical protein